MKKFNTPVALIFFNRPDYFAKLMDVIKELKPPKLYLISDGARMDRENEEELVKKCREIADNSITWECEVIKNYADTNKGCYDRIANCATWIFSLEETCIFLEDDNIPKLSFFYYCEELLEKYKNEEKIFWICGGNYLVEYQNEENSDYFFTRQMFPCGWASWRRAWKNYDGALKLYDDEEIRNNVLNKISNKNIRNYKKIVWEKIRKQAVSNERLYTWDHQWNFAILLNDAYGIVPKKNQITNIGVGIDSTHGGTKLTKHLSQIVMLDSKELTFPMKAPSTIKIDENFEKQIEKRIAGVSDLRMLLSKLKKKLVKRGK